MDAMQQMVLFFHETQLAQSENKTWWLQFKESSFVAPFFKPGHRPPFTTATYRAKRQNDDCVSHVLDKLYDVRYSKII